jgi:predicted NBD/HSP70 family sugar kinase
MDRTNPVGAPARRTLFPSTLGREVNAQAVVDAIIRNGRITRVQISKQTGLSKQTVSLVVRELEAAGWVGETGRIHGALGRKAVTYQLRPHAGYVVAVDLGASRTRTALADLAGKTIAEAEAATDPRGGRFVIGAVDQLCRRMIDDAGVDWTRLLWVTVATPGVVDPRTGTIKYGHNIPGLDELEVERELVRRLALPVTLENDVNLAVLGEHWQGHGRGCDNFAFVGIGDGVGMGVVADGELYRGAHGAAGEIGFIPLGSDPFDPSIQFKGAFEDAVGAKGLIRRYESRGGSPWRTISDIFAAAESGEPAAVAICDEAAASLALALSAVIAILDPERIVLGGEVGVQAVLLEAVRRWLRRLTANPTPVEASRLGERASLIGALAVALQHSHRALFSPRNNPESLTLPPVEMQSG